MGHDIYDRLSKDLGDHLGRETTSLYHNHLMTVEQLISLYSILLYSYSLISWTWTFVEEGNYLCNQIFDTTIFYFTKQSENDIISYLFHTHRASYLICESLVSLRIHDSPYCAEDNYSTLIRVYHRQAKRVSTAMPLRKNTSKRGPPEQGRGVIAREARHPRHSHSGHFHRLLLHTSRNGD